VILRDEDGDGQRYERDKDGSGYQHEPKPAPWRKSPAVGATICIVGKKTLTNPAANHLHRTPPSN